MVLPILVVASSAPNRVVGVDLTHLVEKHLPEIVGVFSGKLLEQFFTIPFAQLMAKAIKFISAQQLFLFYLRKGDLEILDFHNQGGFGLCVCSPWKFLHIIDDFRP